MITQTLSSVVYRSLQATGLGEIRDKVLAQERLTLEDGVQLFESRELAAIGALANHVRERMHGDWTWFNRNLHINATNVCEANCIFCSFARLKTGDAEAYTMTIDQAGGRVRKLRNPCVTEVHS
ncbi:MAG: aminofutalosine synthase MqnE, partial [Rhodobacterales bacterium]|nr:aminofutalosine synthase MqnE [Rhodobacterales bacterium]